MTAQQRSRRALPFEKGTFPLDAPSVPGKSSVASDDAVTWDRDRDGVGRAGLCYRAYSLLSTNALGKLRIAYRRTTWDLSQRLPHSLLKRRTPHVQQQSHIDTRLLNKGHHGENEPFELLVSTDQFGSGKAILKIRDERIRLVT